MTAPTTGSDVSLDKDGKIWVSGLPDPDDLADRIVGDPDWFISLARSRRRAFRNLVEHARSVQDATEKLNSGACLTFALCELRRWQHQHADAFHLILLTALTVDEVGDRFFDLLTRCVGNRVALDYLNDLFRTPFSAEAKARGYSFEGSADITDVLGNVELPLAEPNFSPVSGIEGEVTSAMLTRPLRYRSRDWQEFARLRLVAPILVQQNDEQAYLWRSHSRVMYHLLQRCQTILREDQPALDLARLTANETLSLLEAASLRLSDHIQPSETGEP